MVVVILLESIAKHLTCQNDVSWFFDSSIETTHQSLDHLVNQKVAILKTTAYIRLHLLDYYSSKSVNTPILTVSRYESTARQLTLQHWSKKTSCRIPSKAPLQGHLQNHNHYFIIMTVLRSLFTILWLMSDHDSFDRHVHPLSWLPVRPILIVVECYNTGLFNSPRLLVVAFSTRLLTSHFESSQSLGSW